jgi:pimeloyl-[acyl-carrier protein] methyl ester esterase
MAYKLVFLHGLGSGSAVWIHQRSYFGKDAFAVENYHKSPINTLLNISLSQYAAATVKQIVRETSKPVILIGWSLGALIALELALTVPIKVKGLILTGGTSCFIKSPGYAGGLPRVTVDRLKARLASNVDHMMEFSLMFSPDEVKAGIEEQFKKIALEFSWSQNELLGGVDYLLQQNFRNDLNAIEIPTLIIHGEKDSICPVQGAFYLQEKIRKSKIKVFKGCGHVPFYSKAQDFNTVLEEWVGDCLD